MSKARKRPELPIIGWREWVALPEFNIKQIKAKVDSGARSSSLHAFDVEEFKKNKERWVRFKVHPEQRKSTKVVSAEARVIDYRAVRSSSGQSQQRPVVEATVSLLGETWEIELTLANRDQMGFRMLLGREAFRRRFLVDGGNSYYGGRPKKKTTKRKKKK